MNLNHDLDPHLTKLCFCLLEIPLEPKNDGAADLHPYGEYAGYHNVNYRQLY